MRAPLRPLGLSALLFALACRMPPLRPPPQRSYQRSAPCDGLTRVEPASINGIYLEPADRRGISPEAQGVPLFSAVTVSTRDGLLYFSDVVHGKGLRQAWLHCKLSMEGMRMEPVAGALGSEYLYTPTRDVLASIDTGFGVKVAAASVAEQLIVRPLYDTRGYRPFDRESPPAPQAARGAGGGGGGVAATGRAGGAGAAGKNGSAGGPGANGSSPGQSGGSGGAGGPGGAGQDGANGSGEGGAGRDGQDGGNGANGGRGGEGLRGNPGGPGAQGRRGEDGPALNVLVRPVYSPFYPGEELLYAEVKATWTDINGRPYREEQLNYIFHTGQAFRFRTVGGAGGEGGVGGTGGSGGDGGAGGRGGKGGDGGDGGNGSGSARLGPGGAGGDGGDGGDGGSGGNGAVSGCGGDGGAGGRAGDGGQITVRLKGEADFRRLALAALSFESLPGAPGQGGSRGAAGATGSAGLGGAAGAAGAAGRGGTGSSSGAGGQAGSAGSGGSAGRGAISPLCTNRPGATGPEGAGKRPRIVEEP